MGTFTSARRYVLHTFANTQSALMKKRVSQLHGEHRLPGVPRQAAAPRGAVGDVRRARHRRDVAAAAQAAGRALRARTPTGTAPGWRSSTTEHPEKADGRAADRRGPRRRGSRCCSTSASAICRSSAARRRSRPASCSGCGWRRRCARTCSASSTCSTSRRPACIRPTPRRCCGARPAEGAGQLAVRRRARARRHPPRRLDRRRRARPRASTAAEMLYSGPPDGLRRVDGVADARATCSATTAHRRATPRAADGLAAARRASRATTCTTSTSTFPLGVFTTVTGVSGSGKSSLVSQALVELVAEHLGHDVADGRGGRRRAGARRRRHRSAGGSSAGMERIKRLVRVDQKPIGRTPRSNLATYTGLFDHVRKLFAATKAAQRAALRRRAVLVQRRQGPLRDLRGRGLRDGRAAVPAERLRALPHLPRRALQREDARDHVPRQEHRRRARHDGRRGVRVLRRRAARAPLARRAARGRPRLPAARPAGDRAVRRRGAAHQARDRAAARAARRHALRPRRADDRPASRRRREAAWRSSTAWSTPATP